MISIIIVTWNSGDHIRRCLASLPAEGIETIVVDNGSEDETHAETRRFPQVRLIDSKRNLGFAGGCNLGAREARGDVLLFLNPDTQLQSSLDPLEQVFGERPGCVAAGARLVDEQGHPQRGFLVRRFPTTSALLCELLLINRLAPDNPVNRRYRCLAMDPERPADVDQPAGAALAVRRSAFEALGGFDDRFHPLWFDDVDLCLRLKRAGGDIVYLPQVEVAHQGGHSLEAVNFADKQVYWYRNLIYYVRKNLGCWAGVVIRGGVVLGLAMRAAAELIRPGAGSSEEWSSSRPRTQSRVRNARAAAYWRAIRVAFEATPGGPSQ
jgi:GT2 family glycosyltransferase